MHGPQPRANPRLAGVDVARLVAIVGMLAVHLGPTTGERPSESLYALPHGRASVLFVVLAGLGVSLLARSRNSSVRTTRHKLLWRAALLLPVGLALQMLDHGVLVILGQYAVLFVVAAAIVTAPGWLLLGAAAVLAVAGPLMFFAGQAGDPAAFDRAAPELFDNPATTAHRLLLSGSYPVVVWAAPFLLGVWLGRQPLRDSAVRAALIVGGALVAIGTWLASTLSTRAFGDSAGPGDPRELAVRAAHSQMPLWLIGAAGAAAAVLGVCLVVGDRFPRALHPLVVAGQFALTIYVGHLIALHFAADVLTSEEVGPALARLALFSAAAVLFAMLWSRWRKRGPLEELVDLPWARRPALHVDDRLAALRKVTARQSANPHPDEDRPRH